MKAHDGFTWWQVILKMVMRNLSIRLPPLKTSAVVWWTLLRPLMRMGMPWTIGGLAVDARFSGRFQETEMHNQRPPLSSMVQHPLQAICQVYGLTCPVTFVC